MTLIISHLFPQWVSITSDRMLSIDGVPSKNNSIKLVFFFNDMVFGYTGTAQLPNRDGRFVDTGLWLFETLAEVGKRSVRDASHAVRDKAEDAMQRLEKHRPRRPLAFLGSGWDTEVGADRVNPRPVIVRISNFHDANDQPNPSAPLPNFTRLISSSVAMYASAWVGAERSADEIKWLEDKIHEAVAQKKTGKTIIHLTKESIRQTSRRLQDKYVGKDILAAIIPRTTVSADHVTVVTINAKNSVIFQNGEKVPPLKTETCSWVGRFPQNQDVGVNELPHIVAPGFEGVAMAVKHDGGISRNAIRIIPDADGNVIGVLAPHAERTKQTRAKKSRWRKNQARLKKRIEDKQPTPGQDNPDTD